MVVSKTRTDMRSVGEEAKGKGLALMTASLVKPKWA